MIRQWFSAIHEALDDLIRRYPQAGEEEKYRIQEQWNVIKSLSDEWIEHWLSLEDKLALFRDLEQGGGSASGQPAKLLGPFDKGQGYFKLQMFEHASQCFEETLRLFPDLLAARLFLAMARMHLGEFGEAQRHFQLIAALSEEPKLKAIAYNALGCIQAVGAHLEQAQSYFRQALEADPSFADPKMNLESCRQGTGQLRLRFGSTELQALIRP